MMKSLRSLADAAREDDLPAIGRPARVLAAVACPAVSRRRSVPSGVIEQMSKTWSIRLTKRIRSPLGDQSGESLCFPTKVSRCWLVPSASMTKTCGSPDRSEVKAIRLPSGLKVGEVSIAGSQVSRRRFRPFASER